MGTRFFVDTEMTDQEIADYVNSIEVGPAADNAGDAPVPEETEGQPR